MARIYDITLDVSADMVTWPGDPAVEVLPAKRLARGDSSNVSELKCGTHTGTHVDAPFHFIDGAPGVDEMSLDALVGPARVLDLTHIERTIEPDDLADLAGATRVLFKTRNSSRWSDPTFPETYVSLSTEGARALVDAGVRLVGTDFLSIEQRGAEGHPTHVALLEAGVVILEGVDLRDVEPGDYTLACLPLKLTGMDGAPARAVLIAGGFEGTDGETSPRH